MIEFAKTQIGFFQAGLRRLAQQRLVLGAFNGSDRPVADAKHQTDKTENHQGAGIYVAYFHGGLALVEYDTGSAVSFLAQGDDLFAPPGRVA